MCSMPVNQVVRRLTSAEGYLELDLPDLALEELLRVDEPGALSIPVMWMTAEALKSLGRYDEAIAPLRHVARSVPGPLRRRAWQSLSECLKSAGRMATADDAATTSQQMTDDDQANSTTTRFRLDVPEIGMLEVNISVEDGLMISVKKVDRQTGK